MAVRYYNGDVVFIGEFRQGRIILCLCRMRLSVLARSISGARALWTCGEAAIAGLIFSMHEAGRVRDMRKYPFWARGADVLE